jgi:cytochrome c oxidase assembly protein subunit 15
VVQRPRDLLRSVALAAVIANVGIVITGGAVRLTNSGLGCPTWPKCTPDSFVVSPAMSFHEVVEFGNRLLTFVVGAIAVAGVILALRQRPRRPRVVRLSWLAFAGIPAQGVVGGITVLTGLNPWVVGAHFLVSIGVLAATYAFWRATGETDDPPLPTVPRPLQVLAGILTAASLAVLVVGTWVTGSGPHAGDSETPRNGIDPELISQVHADLVFLILGLAVANYLAAKAVGNAVAARATAWLLGIILAQGLIGFVQYFTHLPEVLVGAHMFGACLVWLATLATLYATRARVPAPAATAGAEVGASAGYGLPPGR